MTDCVMNRSFIIIWKENSWKYESFPVSALWIWLYVILFGHQVYVSLSKLLIDVKRSNNYEREKWAMADRSKYINTSWNAHVYNRDVVGRSVASRDCVQRVRNISWIFKREAPVYSPTAAGQFTFQRKAPCTCPPVTGRFPFGRKARNCLTARFLSGARARVHAHRP